MNTTKYTKPLTAEVKNFYIRQLAEIGQPLNAAKLVNVKYRDIKLLRETDEEFNLDCIDAEMEYAEKVQEMIRKRAFGETSEDVYFKGDVVGTRQLWSDKLLLEEGRRVIEGMRPNTQVDVNINSGVLAIEKPNIEDADDWMNQFSGIKEVESEVSDVLKIEHQNPDQEIVEPEKQPSQEKCDHEDLK